MGKVTTVKQYGGLYSMKLCKVNFIALFLNKKKKRFYKNKFSWNKTCVTLLLKTSNRRFIRAFLRKSPSRFRGIFNSLHPIRNRTEYSRVLRTFSYLLRNDFVSSVVVSDPYFHLFRKHAAAIIRGTVWAIYVVLGDPTKKIKSSEAKLEQKSLLITWMFSESMAKKLRKLKH